MENAAGAISPLCHDHLHSPHTSLHVVERAAVGYGPIPTQHARGLQGPTDLAGVNEPLDAALGLGRVGRDQLDAPIPERPSKLAHRRHAGSLFCHRRFPGGAIGHMRVGVHGQGNPIPLHVPLEPVEGGPGPSYS